MSGRNGVGRDQPTSIGIIKFNARTNSVCSSPSAGCTASPRRVESCSYTTGAESAEQRFVELCSHDDDHREDGPDADSAAVSEADECGSVVADECCEISAKLSYCDSSPTNNVPVEGAISSIKLDENAPKRTDEKALGTKSERLHKFWHKLCNILWHYRTLPFHRIRLMFIAFLIFAYFAFPSFFVGLLTGVYLSLVTFLYLCVSEPRQGRLSTAAVDERLEHDGADDAGLDQFDVPAAAHVGGRQKRSTTRNGTAGNSIGPIYKGWMNILSDHYHPHAFHVNSIQTVLIRLDGHHLRITRPERTMLKHCFHVDPTLTEPEPRMISQKIYDLTDAQVVLRPRRLARRRWFSRKYPICIKLAANHEEHNANGTKIVCGTTGNYDDIMPTASSSSSSSSLLLKRCHSLRHQNQRTVETMGVGNNGRKSSCSYSVCSNNNGGAGGGQRVQLQQNYGSASDMAAAAAVSTAAADDSTDQSTDDEATFRPTFAEPRHCRTTVSPPPDDEDDGVIAADNAAAHIGRITPNKCLRHRRQLRSSSAYIFLFARSAREKERWFHQLRQATLQQNAANYLPDRFATKDGPPRCTSVPSLDRLAAKLPDERIAYTLQNAQFVKQLCAMIAGLGVGGASAGGVDEPVVGAGAIVRMDLGWAPTTGSRNSNGQQQPKQASTEEDQEDNSSSKEFILLVNLIASRVFYDFCRDNYWCEAVRNKIQTKLATIHLPYFIETLELSKLDLGTTTPQIVRVYSPTVNAWGIWSDFDIAYNGMIRLVLETRVNLMKLKSVSESATGAAGAATVTGGATIADPSQPLLERGGGDEQLRQRHSYGGAATVGAGTHATMLSSSTTLPPSSSLTYRIAPNRYSDEEMPESPETSPDEEFGSKLRLDDHSAAGGNANGARRMKTGQRLISFVDRIAHSKYFREASELKPIRKMMEEISSMRLLLNVEVTSLEGRMTCNFPPPPSDRLWYAFRTPPRMSVKAVPQVGDRSVVLSTVSDWIENKLQLILEKNLVLPNMDDVIIPVCSGNKLLQTVLNQ